MAFRVLFIYIKSPVIVLPALYLPGCIILQYSSMQDALLAPGKICIVSIHPVRARDIWNGTWEMIAYKYLTWRIAMLNICVLSFPKYHIKYRLLRRHFLTRATWIHGTMVIWTSNLGYKINKVFVSLLSLITIYDIKLFINLYFSTQIEICYNIWHISSEMNRGLVLILRKYPPFTKWSIFRYRFKRFTKRYSTHISTDIALPTAVFLIYHIMPYNNVFLIRRQARMMSYTETEMSSFWRNFRHWLHWKLSFWQLSVQPVMKISSKWWHFRFSVHLLKPATVWIIIHGMLWSILKIKLSIVTQLLAQIHSCKLYSRISMFCRCWNAYDSKAVSLVLSWNNITNNVI